MSLLPWLKPKSNLTPRERNEIKYAACKAAYAQALGEEPQKPGDWAFFHQWTPQQIKDLELSLQKQFTRKLKQRFQGKTLTRAKQRAMLKIMLPLIEKANKAIALRRYPLKKKRSIITLAQNFRDTLTTKL